MSRIRLKLRDSWRIDGQNPVSVPPGRVALTGITPFGSDGVQPRGRPSTGSMAVSPRRTLPPLPGLACLPEACLKHVRPRRKTQLQTNKPERWKSSIGSHSIDAETRFIISLGKRNPPTSQGLGLPVYRISHPQGLLPSAGLQSNLPHSARARYSQPVTSPDVPRHLPLKALLETARSPKPIGSHGWSIGTEGWHNTGWFLPYESITNVADLSVVWVTMGTGTSPSAVRGR